MGIMLHIAHTFDWMLRTWSFECTTEPSIQGSGGRTYEGSIEASEHAVRHLLSRDQRDPVSLDTARSSITHSIVESDYGFPWIERSNRRLSRQLREGATPT